MRAKYHWDSRYYTNRVQKYLHMINLRLASPHHSPLALRMFLQRAVVRGAPCQSFTPRTLIAVAGA